MAKKGFSMIGMLISIGIIGIILVAIISTTTKYTERKQKDNPPPSVKEIDRVKDNVTYTKALSAVSQVVIQIKMENNGTLEGVFRNNEDAKNKFRKYMGELAIINFSFEDFNPECKQICGKIIIKDKNTILVLKNGIQ